MANIDLKQAATKGYVEGDEYLTKDSSGGLNWTPAHEAPYELLENDISSGTSTKGLVSGEQLAALGGGGGAVKTILLRDDGAGGSTWQHLISSADLTGGDDFIFILGSSSAADLNVVCIPTEASVPELANISELKLVVYGGSGKSGFSENFNGVGTGAQVLGTEGVAGSGCVIARKVELDTWYLSYEVTKPSGPEVLKDWTTVSTNSNLFEGTDLATASLDGVVIEIKRSQVQSTNLILTYNTQGKGNPSNPFGAKSTLRSDNYIGSSSQDDTNGYRILESLDPNYPTYIQGRIELYEVLGGGNLPAGLAIAGYSSSLTLIQAEYSNRRMTIQEALATASDAGGKLPELWLTLEGVGPTTINYRIIREW